MAVKAKICGLDSSAAVAAALAGGASHLGFVFYPPSPRAVTPAEAAALAGPVPAGTGRVGLFVDPDDAAVAAVLAHLPLDLLQLHGSEPPARMAALKARFGRPVMKAIKIGVAADIEHASAYLGAADWLLFDARPPAQMKGALPGGNAVSFDWQWLAGRRWPLPWMLSGGLHAGNVATAVAITGAVMVDVSSGVEDAPGRKNADKIAAFLAAVRAL
jgi:phosphoribosylanthranilate isomerase